MATVRNWSMLSDSYRKRLERAGITRSDYERGVSVQAARGHSEGEGREALARRLIRAKEIAYGDRPKFNRERSAKAVRERRDGTKRSAKELRLAMKLLKMRLEDQLIELDEEMEEVKDALYYH